MAEPESRDRPLKTKANRPMTDPFDTAAGLLQEWVLIPLLYRADMMQWEDVAANFATFMVYGAVQVVLVFVICAALEKWRPLEKWEKHESVGTDILYTLIARVGILPLFTYVLFYQLQVWITGWLTDHGYVPPTLDSVFPAMMWHPVISFFVYAMILDHFDYWRHRLSHRFGVWYALHSVHHAQRQMTFWSDDRNHLFDDIISAIWFGMIALIIGVSPLQFPLLVLVLRAIESLAHANTPLSFGTIGDRLLISPRFHRAHHSVLAAGQRSCNYGSVLPWWDMLYGTADFSREYIRTGDPGADEAMHTGGWVAQQWSGIKRMVRMMRRKKRFATPQSGQQTARTSKP
jgi:sterol desaturase/sphingolipid hydroxylase (fatty acid hydroxylase superfamily)